MNNAAHTVHLTPDITLSGNGVSVAVLDTGICPMEDFIIPRNRIICFKDFVNGKNYPYDDNGHGTHVAGCLGANGYLSKGKFRGIAPSCNIVCLKILDETGSGTAKWSFDAIRWLIENKEKYNIKIVNMSVGTNDRSIYSSLSYAANMLWQKGLVVCAASGNNNPRGITSPGINNSIITIGSWEEHKIFSLSNNKNTYSKPDVFAPGKDIVSCMSNTFLFSMGNRSKDKIVDNYYIKMSGSSMSTPIVSGAAAILLEKYPILNNDEVKDIIISSANSPENPQLLNIKNMLLTAQKYVEMPKNIRI